MERQYYVITEEEDCDENKIVGINVTNADYFDQNECQSDWTDEGVIETVINGGFQAGEQMDGVIEVQGSKEAVEACLQAVPEFEVNDEFSKFIEQFVDLDC